MAIHPFLVIIINFILNYVADNADEIIDSIRKQFPLADSDPELRNAIQEFGYDPTELTLDNLNKVLLAKKQSTDALARVLLNKTTIL